MKKVLAVIVVLLNFSCQEGLIFNQDVDILELKTKAKAFDMAIDRRNVGIMNNGVSTFTSLTKNYYDSSRLSERCLYPIKSEKLLLKINNEGETISSKFQIALPPSHKKFQNRSYFFNENYFNGLDFNIEIYDEDLQFIQNLRVPLASYVKGGYNGFYRSNLVFIRENEFVISGNLSRNMNNSTSFFVARIKDGKLLQYQQSTEIIDGTVLILNGIRVNQNEIIFLVYGGINIKPKYRIYRYKFTDNTVVEELELPFGMEVESYIGIERINDTSVALIPIESYPKSLNFKNGGIQIYDFEKKIIHAKPFEVEGMSSGIFSVKGYKVFEDQVFIEAEMDSGRIVIKLDKDGLGKAVFKKQTNFGNLFYFKNEKKELEMVEIGDVLLPKNRLKSVFFKHSSFDKFTSKTLFESINYSNPCFY